MIDTTTMILNWERFVSQVQDGNLEPAGDNDIPEFMYCEKRHAFISDPDLIKEIVRARKHTSPFMLVGSMNTGKNIFLELVAKGNENNTRPQECIDENVDGTREEMMEKFFGMNGLVAKHRDALIHFDMLQNAAEWGPFIDKINVLARTQTLYLTDGQMIRVPSCRVVGGATIDLEPVIARRPQSSLDYLYNYLKTNQFVQTFELGKNTQRMSILLAEILASQVLDPKEATSHENAERIQTITAQELNFLVKYSWPKGYTELVKVVRDAIENQSWKKAIEVNLRPEVFICWPGKAKDDAAKLSRLLNAAQVPTFFSENAMGIGNWKAQIEHAINHVDFVILVIIKNMFSKTAEGYYLEEFGDILKRRRRINREIVIPVPVDGSSPSDMQLPQGIDTQMIRHILAQQWFPVDPNTGRGLDKLYTALMNEFGYIKESALS